MTTRKALVVLVFVASAAISYFVIGAVREDNELLPVVAIVMIVFVSALYLLNEYSKK